MKVYVLVQKDWDNAVIHAVLTDKPEAVKWASTNRAKWPGYDWNVEEFELDKLEST